MAFDKEWNENVPEGTELIALGDDRIRDFKYAIRERLAVEHNFFANEAGQTVGIHKNGSIKEQYIQDSAITTPKIANKAITAEKFANSVYPLQVVSAHVAQVNFASNVWSLVIQLPAIVVHNYAVLICRYDLGTEEVTPKDVGFRFYANAALLLEDIWTTEPCTTMPKYHHEGCRTHHYMGSGSIEFSVYMRGFDMTAPGSIWAKNIRFTVLYS